jgi:hypothetical protein
MRISYQTIEEDDKDQLYHLLLYYYFTDRII